MVRISSVFTAGAALLLTTGALANDSPPYPRLGGVNNGSPHNYDDRTYQASLAKLHVVVLNIWPGWETNKTMTMEQVIRNLKASGPATRVFLYQNSMEVAEGNAAAAPIWNKVDQMRWWLYPTGGSGTKLKSEFGNQTGKPNYQINTTLFTPRDSSGYQHWEWHARWVIQQYYRSNPSMDGFFEDNVFYQPRISGDWNRDGVQDTPAQAGRWLREGYRARFNLMRQLMPGKHVIGNIADWGHKNAVLTELQGALNGGVMEGIIGASYGPETWGSWAEALRWYRKTMDAVAAPKWVIFNQHGTATDYQGMRYGLATCLMDDGYYSYTDKAKGYTGVPWFDEYDAKLGRATSPPPTVAWQKGVWRRDFENGIALVNPRGNGAQDVTLEEEFKRISGRQAPTVNSGQNARTVRLQDRDGIILLRNTAKPLPSAPTLMSVN
jgi:hypothetical protein